MPRTSKGRPKPSSSKHARRGSSKVLRFLIRFVVVCFLAVLIWCAALYYMITHFEGIPQNSGNLQADVGIVLGATLWEDKPSPALLERLDHSLQLFRSGLFSSIIVTGGLDNNGSTLTEAEGMRNYLVEQGVPAKAIVMDTLSRSTYENLLFSKQIMESKGWDSAVIVTHKYHGSRAGDIAKKLGFNPVLVSVTDSKVLNMSYHETREILAYTKWIMTKLFL
jgi:uncharacterized SAM-binding protein YcdF (DUF218 family)